MPEIRIHENLSPIKETKQQDSINPEVNQRIFKKDQLTGNYRQRKRKLNKTNNG